MYCKRTVNLLYKIYSDTRSDEILWQLVLACEPIISIILSRWSNLDFNERIDFNQSMQLQLFNNLQKRTDENLQRYLVAPISYLWSYLRMLATRIWWSKYNYGMRTDSESELPEEAMLGDFCV